MTDATKTARDRFKLCIEAEQDNRTRAEEADKFSSGLEQWPEILRNEREIDGRPCLVMDEINQYINQIKNDQRQNKAAIKVRPVDDKADKKVAEMMQGIVRHIEDTSGATIAYDTAFEHALRGGYGYWRVITDYCYEDSFDQEIKIVRIRDRFSVHLDPNRQEPDGSDAQYGFITEWMSREDFKKAYPSADPVSWDEYKSDAPDWVTDDSVRIADYYFFREEQRELLQLPDGSTAFADEIPDEYDTSGLNRRTTTVKKLIWQKISGADVLEETEWMGKYIPIVELIGNESVIDGKRVLTGIVNAAMDAQRMHNYAISAMVEGIALAPKSPHIAAVGQLEGFEKQWEESNRKNISVLPYHPVSVDGVAVPPPSRQPPPGISQGWAEIVMASRSWVQSSMGMYNASVGAPSNEKSGKAILARQREGDVASFHYHDNLSTSIRHTGRILIDLIPKVYDTKRMVRILGEDGTPDSAMIDPMMGQASMEARQEDGSVLMLFNPTIGKYDVAVNVGPSYSTKRQEAAEAQTQMIQAAPQLLPMIGDIMIRNMDWPGADQIADRLKEMLPPQLKQLENKNKNAGDMKAAQIAQSEQVLMQKAETLFQKEQELMQAQQAMQEAGQATAKQITDLEAIKSEMEALKTEISAERRILAAEKAKASAEIKLAQNEMATVQQNTEERAEVAMENNNSAEGIANALGQLLSQQGQISIALVQAIEQMNMAMKAPKRYHYDPEGNIIGSEPILN